MKKKIDKLNKEKSDLLVYKSKFKILRENPHELSDVSLEILSNCIENWFVWDRIKDLQKQSRDNVIWFWREKIYRFILGKVSDKEISEELTNEVFKKFIKSIKRDNEYGLKNERAFVYKIARNTVIDFYRKRGREPIMESINEENNLEISDIIRPEGEFESKKLQVYIKGIIKNITPRSYKEVLTLYCEEYNISEIAKIMGKSEDSISAIKKRAIAKIEKLIKK